MLDNYEQFLWENKIPSIFFHISSPFKPSLDFHKHFKTKCFNHYTIHHKSKTWIRISPINLQVEHYCHIFPFRWSPWVLNSGSSDDIRWKKVLMKSNFKVYTYVGPSFDICRQNSCLYWELFNQSSAYDLISRHAVAIMHSGQ